MLLLLACSGPEDGKDPVAVPATYDFEGVSYEGQSMRHLLITDLDDHIGGLTARIDGGWFPVAGEVTAELDFYYHFDSETSGTIAPGFSTDPAPAQATYDDVATGKDLASKIAGNDPEGQHEDWSAGVIGWAGAPTPESLLLSWFQQLDDAAVARSNGDIPVGADGKPVANVAVTGEGLHLQELVQKFLLGAVGYSQAADDYLDDGLAASNVLVAGEPYTALAHAWDEGFGYFGASRDFCGGEETAADPGYSDTYEPDGAIDLLSEVCWGHAKYAARRDLGATVATDQSGDAFEGFLEGRALIASTEGELSEAQLDELRGWRDQAIGAWEETLAASAVHYANDTLGAMGTFGTEAYNFTDHAGAWSELKAFLLVLQFNPASRLSDEELEEIHDLLGDAPASTSEADLLDVRARIGEAYGFDAANLGDDDGAGGW